MGRRLGEDTGAGPGTGRESWLSPRTCWALSVTCSLVGSWQPRAGWCSFPTLVSEGGRRVRSGGGGLVTISETEGYMGGVMRTQSGLGQGGGRRQEAWLAAAQSC